MTQLPGKKNLTTNSGNNDAGELQKLELHYVMVTVVEGLGRQ